MVVGCLSAGKIVQRLNQHLFIGTSLLVMGVCAFSVPFCANLVALSATVVLNGFFTGFLTVGELILLFLSRG